MDQSVISACKLAGSKATVSDVSGALDAEEEVTDETDDSPQDVIAPKALRINGIDKNKVLFFI